MNKIEFKLRNKEYEVKDVTLRNYKDVLEMLNAPNPETPYEIVEFLSGCPKEDLKSLKFSDWYFLWEEVQEMLKGGNSTSSIMPVIEFMGKKYGLPQIENMSVGEFADLDIIVSSSNPESKLAEIAAILYRPVIEQTENFIVLEEYNTRESKKREKLFEHLPLSVIRSASAFFLQSVNRSLENTLVSFKNQNEMSMFLQDLEDLEKSLPQELGGFSLMPFLEKIPSDLTKLQECLFEEPSIGFLGKKTKLKSNNLI